MNHYRDSIGSLWFIGEIVNTGTVELVDIRVVVSLLDAAGQTVATGSSSTVGGDILNPGEFTVWRALLNNAPAEWADVRTQAQGARVTNFTRDRIYTELKTEGVTLVPPESQYGWVKASGQVVNTGTGTARFVEVTMGLYDQSGTLIAVANGYAKLEQIPPGGSAPFSLDFTGVRELPAHKEVFVSGSKAP